MVAVDGSTRQAYPRIFFFFCFVWGLHFVEFELLTYVAPQNSALSAFYGAMSVMNKDEDELYIISALLRPTPTCT